MPSPQFRSFYYFLRCATTVLVPEPSTAPKKSRVPSAVLPMPLPTSCLWPCLIWTLPISGTTRPAASRAKPYFFRKGKSSRLVFGMPAGHLGPGQPLLEPR